MDAALSRWLVWPVLMISVVIWLGISMVTSDAIHTLVKSNFDFTRAFGSVSGSSLVIALFWSAIVGHWMRVAVSAGVKSIALGGSVVVVWTVGVAAFTAVGIDLLWSFRWGVVVISVVSLMLEIAVAVWIFRRMIVPPSFGIGIHGALLNATTTLSWLIWAKALLLCLSPGVVIRMG